MLPKLLHDVVNGTVVLEYIQPSGKAACVDLRAVVGLLESDAVQNDNIIHTNVGVVLLGNQQMLITKHPYTDLRDVLYPNYES